MICPACKENRAHRSRRAGLKDWAMSLGFRVPYRCRACKTRWYAFLYGKSLLESRTPEERQVVKLRRALRFQRAKRQIVGYALSSLILLVVLYYLLNNGPAGG
jgi:hypothetical protein